MDNTKIKAGAILYLPVFHEGALLAMGDVHACMGDGEIMVTGLEIPAEVTVTLEVLKGISIDNPMLEDGEACYTIASHENVETAVYTAVKAMTDILMRELGMSWRMPVCFSPPWAISSSARWWIQNARYVWR